MEKKHYLIKKMREWNFSISGKITHFVLVSIVIAFFIGACGNWIFIKKFTYQQWVNRAEVNAQIITYVVRNIYTTVSVETSPDRHISRIVSTHLIGDPESVIETGFNPVDVLSLASQQTYNPIWLFSNTSQQGFVGMSDNSLIAEGTISIDGDNTPDALTKYYVGFAKINGEEWFISAVPIFTPAGDFLGTLVSSIGTKKEIYAAYHNVLKQSFVFLLIILIAALILVTFIIRRFFKPVPLLINAITDISDEKTDQVTPCLEYEDEIGLLARAIEKLRLAMVERGYLQRMHEMLQQIEFMALHDSLTQLPNREAFRTELKKRTYRAVHQNARFNLLFLDLDNFKPVNDTFGHGAGDKVLEGVAARIRALLKENDFAARLGGDEFAIIQSVAVENRSEAIHLSEQIISAIAAPFTFGKNKFSVGCSIGIAEITENEVIDDFSAHMINADLALYTSKYNGRNCYHFYTKGMKMNASDNVFINQEIILGIENNEFELKYHPVINLNDMQIIGYEALIRWNHPEKGLLYPEQFIHAAEKSGVISRLGEWVIHESSSAVAKWPEKVSVSVNISAYQIHRPGLVEIIKEALHQNRLTFNRFEIEITDSERLNPDIALPVLNELRDLGIAITMDDLGTGYAALDYLLIYPFTRVKISNALISKIEQDSSSAHLVNMLIQFAAERGIQVIAEGVEAKEQCEILRQISCQYVQGYIFSLPVNEQDVLATFDEYKRQESIVYA